MLEVRACFHTLQTFHIGGIRIDIVIVSTSNTAYFLRCPWNAVMVSIPDNAFFGKRFGSGDSSSFGTPFSYTSERFWGLKILPNLGTLYLPAWGRGSRPFYELQGTFGRRVSESDMPFHGPTSSVRHVDPGQQAE
jgi:hypothetical protein